MPRMPGTRLARACTRSVAARSSPRTSTSVSTVGTAGSSNSTAETWWKAATTRLAGSTAAEQAAAVLPASRVVAAFHHVSAVLLLDPAVPTVDTDVLVLGDDRAATDLVQALASRVPGIRGIYAGRLRNARQVEALTANLISVNRRYQAHAGLRVTDV